MSDDQQTDQQEGGDGEGSESSQDQQNEPPEEASESASSGSDDEELPAIEDDERAEIPDDIDPEAIEEEAGAGADDDTDESSEDADSSDDSDTEGQSSAETMEPDTGASVAQAGDLYVSVVQSFTNAQIRKHGGPEADTVDRDHFEQYDLSEHFNATMDMMGVGSDLDPHEALLLATAISVGDGLASETDVLDRQIDRLMDKAMNGNGGEEA